MGLQVCLYQPSHTPSCWAWWFSIKWTSMLLKQFHPSVTHYYSEHKSNFGCVLWRSVVCWFFWSEYQILKGRRYFKVNIYLIIQAIVSYCITFNPLRPNFARHRSWAMSSLVQATTYRLFSAKPLLKPIPNRCQFVFRKKDQWACGQIYWFPFTYMRLKMSVHNENHFCREN